MHPNPLSKHVVLSLLLIIALAVTFLSCTPTTPGDPLSTSGNVASTVEALEGQLDEQATQIARLQENLSYMATRVGAVAAGTPTTTRPTRTPVAPTPTYPPTHTTSPELAESFPSPDGSRQAFLQDGGTLVLQEPNGQRRELVNTDEITSLAWFPDSTHVAYSVRDPSQEVTATQDQLWIVNIESGESWHLGNGYKPRVSPDGRYVAVLSGILWGDACMVGYDLAIFELGDDRRLVNIHHQNDFAGLPGPEEEEAMIATFHPMSIEGVEPPGLWQTPTRLKVALGWGCCEPGDQDTGVYLLDLTTLVAQKSPD